MKKAEKPRATTKLTIAGVSKIACALPGVEESITARGIAWKVKGKLRACTPLHKSAEPDSLVVRIDFDERARLMAAQPDIYYVTDHYVGYPSVLVRIGKVGGDELRNLLGIAAIELASKDKSTRSAKARVSRKSQRSPAFSAVAITPLLNG